MTAQEAIHRRLRETAAKDDESSEAAANQVAAISEVKVVKRPPVASMVIKRVRSLWDCKQPLH